MIYFNIAYRASKLRFQSYQWEYVSCCLYNYDMAISHYCRNVARHLELGGKLEQINYEIKLKFRKF